MRDPLTQLERIAQKIAQNPFSFASKTEDVHPFDKRNIHPEISEVSKNLFDDGHYEDATFKAYKRLEKIVRNFSPGKRGNGFSLMQKVFGGKTPHKKLNNFSSDADRKEQEGYRDIFIGAIKSIRNSRAHEDEEAEIIETMDQCLDHLDLASILMRKIDNAPDDNAP